MNGRVFRRGNTWSYVVDVGANTHSGRKQQMRGGFPTKREADKALRDLLRQVDNQRYVEPSKLTLSRYVEKEWLPSVAPPHLRETTWSSYSRELRLNVLPMLGEIPLQTLRPADLNRLYAYLLSDGRKDGRGGLSPRSVRYIHTILRKSLADARRRGRLDINVADLADPPKSSNWQTPKFSTWTVLEVRQFLEGVQDERLFPGWLLAITTGMRRGELLGLRWVDVDLQVGQLAVLQTLVMVDGQLRYSIPKTRRSRRNIELDQASTRALANWQQQQQRERQLWGDAWEDHGLVFTKENGAPINPDSWSGTFNRLVAQHGLPRIRYHDLRHTQATLMLAAKVHPKVVSERLGHHSTAFTLDVYTHVMPGMQHDAAETVAGLILPSMPKQGPSKKSEEPLEKRGLDRGNEIS